MGSVPTTTAPEPPFRYKVPASGDREALRIIAFPKSSKSRMTLE